MSEKLRQEKKTDTKNGVVRLILVVVVIAVEIFWIIYFFNWIGQSSKYMGAVLHIIAFIVALYIYGRRTNAAMKMPWIILILSIPLFGIIMYFLSGRKNANKNMRQRFKKIDALLMPELKQNDDVLEAEKVENADAGGISNYLWNTCGFPVYNNTHVEFYSDPVPAVEALKDELRRAKKFIFMEYHAIENKEAFFEIHEILKQKASEGLDVRLFYDDVGSIGFINGSFSKRLEKEGIRCRVFNPVVPLLNIFMNNRDHRKITVVDGRVAFTGGYNLANEYFHITEPYGYWKDVGVKLTGDCVESFTVMFLEMWNAIRWNRQDDMDFTPFFNHLEYPGNHLGYVQPYADSPLDDDHVGENVYLYMLDRASKYAWFITPYLIITDDLLRSFTLAARRGVDVRIITPGVPDKKITYWFTRSYYAHLIRGKVRIFEYAPGFCHAKMSVVDGKMATCGTINLDYRSLYHHFENGVFMYNNQAVSDIESDFKTLFPQCREVTDQYRDEEIGMFKRGIYCLLRLFAPLL